MARDFLRVKPGDVIVLDKEIDEPLVVKFENSSKIYSYPGS
jgi:Surface presentation of antigens (SPOA).